MRIAALRLLSKTVLVSLAVMLAGCHQQAPTIVVITPTGGLHYWEVFDRKVEADAATAGIHVELAAPQSVNDYTEQAEMVHRAVLAHVQGIIVSPSHQLVLASVLRQAELSGIPVVVVAAPIALAAKDYAAFIGWDEEEAGRLAARRFVSLLGGKGEVGVVAVSPTVEGSSLMEKGFADEIARAPRLKLVSVKYGLSDWARARQASLDLVAEHPQIGGIFTLDEFATHAAACAFDGRPGRRPALIGVSQEQDEIRALEQGRMEALIVSDPRELAVQAMRAMRSALHGDPAGRYSGQLPVRMVDRKTMAESPVMRMMMENGLGSASSVGKDADVAP